MLNKNAIIISTLSRNLLTYNLCASYFYFLLENVKLNISNILHMICII